jgi:hypothetical protein
MNNILKQKEAKALSLTVKKDEAAVDLSGCTLLLGVKRSKNEVDYAFSKEDADFDKSRAAEGIVSVFLSDTDLDQIPGTYVAELKVQFPGSPAAIDKSADFFLTIQQAVTP